MRILALRRDDTCVSCHPALAVGDRAGWDKVAKTVTCMSCLWMPVAASEMRDALVEFARALTDTATDGLGSGLQLAEGDSFLYGTAYRDAVRF